MSPGRRNRRILATVLAVCAVAAVLVLATRPDAPRLHGLPVGPVTADLDGRQQAELDVVSGATTVTVRAADLGGRLFRAWTPPGARVAPEAGVDGDVVRLGLRDTGDGGDAQLVVEVAAGVTWRIRLAGGATEQTVDLRGGRLGSLEFAAGSSRIEAMLPRPEGTVPVRLAGGASTVGVHLPAGVPARVLIGSGAGQAAVDGDVRTGVAAGTVLATSGFDAAPDRYTVDSVAGVSAFTLDRDTP